jgi:uncharacterized SAM-binding protein YcdF (DUF218 family)
MVFILKKIVTPFLLPPGVFIVILIGFGIWLLWGKKQRPVWICIGTALLIWISSITPIADWLTASLEAEFRVVTDAKADVIIMLGGSAYLKVEDLSGTGAPGPGTMARMVTAARLQRRLKIPILLSGGRVYSTSASSARLSQRFLEDLGISENQIIVEDQSRDTYENALFSQKICQQYGFKAPLLVTSGYHLKRALLCFEKVGLKVTPYPCDLTTWPNKEYHWYHFLPNAGTLARTTAALHEWLGLAFYRLNY